MGIPKKVFEGMHKLKAVEGCSIYRDEDLTCKNPYKFTEFTNKQVIHGVTFTITMSVNTAYKLKKIPFVFSYLSPLAQKADFTVNSDTEIMYQEILNDPGHSSGQYELNDYVMSLIAEKVEREVMESLKLILLEDYKVETSNDSLYIEMTAKPYCWYDDPLQNLDEMEYFLELAGKDFIKRFSHIPEVRRREIGEAKNTNYALLCSLYAGNGRIPETVMEEAKKQGIIKVPSEREAKNAMSATIEVPSYNNWSRDIKTSHSGDNWLEKILWEAQKRFVEHKEFGNFYNAIEEFTQKMLISRDREETLNKNRKDIINLVLDKAAEKFQGESSLEDFIRFVQGFRYPGRNI